MAATRRDTLRSSAWLDLADEPLVLHPAPDTCGRYDALWPARCLARSSRPSALAPPAPERRVRATRCYAPRVRASQGLTPIAAPPAPCTSAAVSKPSASVPRRGPPVGLRRLPRRPADQLRGPVDAGPESPDVWATPLPSRTWTPPHSSPRRCDSPSRSRPISRCVLYSGWLRELVNGSRSRPGSAAGLARGPRVNGGTPRTSGCGRSPAAVRCGFRASLARATRGLGVPGTAGPPGCRHRAERLGTDADGLPLSSYDRYVLGFAPDAPPPRTASGSTAYADTGAPLVRRPARPGADPDGALAVHVQREPPGPRAALELAADTGWRLHAALRLYWPRDEALELDVVPLRLHRLP